MPTDKYIHTYIHTVNNEVIIVNHVHIDGLLIRLQLTNSSNFFKAGAAKSNLQVYMYVCVRVYMYI
jgi:hypothetical protein